jgi:hypothetical protein
VALNSACPLLFSYLMIYFSGGKTVCLSWIEL